MRSPFPFTPVWWSENRPWKTIVSVLTPREWYKCAVSCVDQTSLAESVTPSPTSVSHEDTFFDCALLHLLTTATLDRLRGLYPDGRFEVRRFRPNIVVETAYGDRDFVENA